MTAPAELDALIARLCNAADSPVWAGSGGPHNVLLEMLRDNGVLK